MWPFKKKDSGLRTITSYWRNMDGRKVTFEVNWKIKYKKEFNFEWHFADTYLNLCDYCRSRNISGFNQKKC